MARWFYSLLLYLLTPLILLRLIWRGRRQREYLQHIPERWGFYPDRTSAAPLIWLHAVSVGETRALQPLIEQLSKTYPKHQLLLTAMTPTGRAAGQELYREGVCQAYLPYDFPGASRRFLNHFQPVLGIFMETEIWPNLLAACQQQAIPTLLVNARLSARSARGYGRVSSLVGPALRQFKAIVAQSQEDALRLQALGGVNIEVCGNLKFDATPNEEKLELGQAWRQVIGERLVWLAGSTREGEESLLLDVFTSLHRQYPELLLVLVPRHPQRFDEVERLIQAKNLSMIRRSQGKPEPGHQVWLGDSMGEMAAYYRLADIGFVGGSLLPLGGQNLIEAAACGCPVLIGPHTFNFTQAVASATASGAARQVSGPIELGAVLQELLDKPLARQEMTQAAREFSLAHRGAAAKTLEIIRKVLPPEEVG